MVKLKIIVRDGNLVLRISEGKQRFYKSVRHLLKGSPNIEKHWNAENKRTTWDINADRENPHVVDFTEQELAYLKCACEKLSDTPAPDYLWDTVEKIYAAAQVTA